jgi:GNAT superfamily N-acetyltransferase
MRIAVARTDTEIARCFPVMAQLRPHLSEARFVEQVRRQAAAGYQLAYLEADGAVRSVAGFRVLEMLAFGKMLYVDDLVTREDARSRGYGGELFDWLVEQARANECRQLQLDSGVQRFGAHRFYLTKRMAISSHHFSLTIDPV